MDISKYLTNKDIQLSNDDINIEKLEKDLRKGYVLSEEIEKARQEALKESTATYTELEDKFNKLEKSYNDIEARNTELTNSLTSSKLEVEIISQGFKKEDINEVSKLRNTIYAEEQDNSKAIGMIKERYGATFFPQTEEVKPKVEVPEDTPFNQPVKPQEDIKITRNTKISSLIIK